MHVWPRRVLVVFVTVQNFIGIAAVIIFNILHVRFENVYSLPQNRSFGGFERSSQN